jgi:hypothetical protein
MDNHDLINSAYKKLLVISSLFLLTNICFVLFLSSAKSLTPGVIRFLVTDIEPEFKLGSVKQFHSDLLPVIIRFEEEQV